MACVSVGVKDVSDPSPALLHGKEKGGGKGHESPQQCDSRAGTKCETSQDVIRSGVVWSEPPQVCTCAY